MNQIVEVGQLVKVPAGTFADCVKTKEGSPLAFRVENKWYCRGVGHGEGIIDGGRDRHVGVHHARTIATGRH